MREVTWTPVWDSGRQGWGVELLRLGETRAASSAILFDGDGVPFELSYGIEWDARWTVRRVAITVVQRSERRRVDLESDGEGRWRDGAGTELDGLAGCLDADIWPTPFTNTFPIRRLDLRIGERADIAVVLIEAPRLTVATARQAYTRLARDRFRFETGNGEFQADLEVDEDGVVVDYPGLFRRLT